MYSRQPCLDWAVAIFYLDNVPFLIVRLPCREHQINPVRNGAPRGAGLLLRLVHLLRRRTQARRKAIRHRLTRLLSGDCCQAEEGRQLSFKQADAKNPPLGICLALRTRRRAERLLAGTVLAIVRLLQRADLSVTAIFTIAQSARGRLMGMWIFFGLLLAATVANIVGPEGAGILRTREATWVLTLGLLVAMLVTAGRTVRSRWDGIFIDRDNRISLSRLQLIIWTGLIISALFTGALTNMTAGVENPLGINVPEEIWALLGLGAFTAVAAPVIKENQKRAAFRAPETAQAPYVSGGGRGSERFRRSSRRERNQSRPGAHQWRVVRKPCFRQSNRCRSSLGGPNQWRL
jgi:hypothetical protein